LAWLIQAAHKQSRKSWNVVVFKWIFNNAGFGLSGPFLSHDPKRKQAEIEVNVQAFVALTHHFGETLAARGKGGIITESV